MDYHSEVWKGYIVGLFVSSCVNLDRKNCPGCKAKLLCPLLHQHLQFSLLDKIRIHFDHVKPVLIKRIERLYKLIEDKLPHSDNMNVDRELYCKAGVYLLENACPESIYWGRYIDEFNDSYICDLVDYARKDLSRIS